MPPTTTSRPELDTYFARMALLVATRGTCARRQVGCVLVDHHKHVLATGYNGPPSGFVHCTAEPCAGARAASGDALDKCEAVHAEANALLQCANAQAIWTTYCTDSPCVHCVKLLLNTSCRRLVYVRAYAHTTALGLWYRAGRQVISVPEVEAELELRP
jgi:dCMP deaminase